MGVQTGRKYSQFGPNWLGPLQFRFEIGFWTDIPRIQIGLHGYGLDPTRLGPQYNGS